MKRLIISTVMIFALAVGGVFAGPQVHAVNLFSQPCGGAGSTSAACSTTGADPITGKNGIIHKAVIIIATIAGAIAVIMMVAGGLMYVLANGDSGRIKTARDTVVYSAIGLVIIAIGQTLIIFIIDRI